MSERTCPRCGSTDTRYICSDEADGFLRSEDVHVYECSDCRGGWEVAKGSDRVVDSYDHDGRP